MASAAENPAPMEAKEPWVAVGFLTLVIALIALGTIAVSNLRRLNGATNRLYLHPFQVSNAALNIRLALSESRLSMLALVHHDEPQHEAALREAIQDLPRHVAHSARIIERHFLGDRALVAQNKAALADWTRFQRAVLKLLEHDPQQARIRVLSEGTSRYEKLAAIQDEIIAFARRKARALLHEADRIRASSEAQLSLAFVITVAFAVVTSALVFFRTRRATSALARSGLQLAQANTELLRSNESLRRFAYVASHDLREPLRKILNFGQLLATEKSEQLDEEGAHYAQRMQDAAQRLDELIVNLLSYSRVGSQSEQQVAVNLDRLLIETTDDLALMLEESGAELHWADLPDVVGAPTQLKQLFQNLISNAVKFRKADTAPKIEITWRRDRERCVISVSDNGIGFEAQYAEKIFGVFQRLHSRDLYPGTGIGLAICQKIVEIHGGTISAHATLDGARFEFDLPLASEARNA
ncbi:MAG: hypothetical protein H6707_20875 [Deltaproteobacteria bacterium]|nr:hypothetical protein [Deltaproteobacteria bacterium]